MADRDELEAVARLTEAGLFDRMKHPRDRGGRWVKSVFGGVEYTGAVRVDSPLWGKDQYGHVVGSHYGERNAPAYAYGRVGASSRVEPHILISVEDPGRDHPSVRDMLADNPHLSYDQLEFHDIVPISKIRDAQTDRPVQSPDPILQQVEHERRVADAIESNKRRREQVRAKGPVTVSPEVRAAGRERARATAERMRRMVH